MNLSKHSLLKTIKWFEKHDYQLLNGTKKYSSCSCNRDYIYNIIYTIENGYILWSFKTIEEMYSQYAYMHVTSSYTAMGMFIDNKNCTPSNVKGVNHIVKKLS
jgi:hypothetical protein